MADRTDRRSFLLRTIGSAVAAAAALSASDGVALEPGSDRDGADGGQPICRDLERQLDQLEGRPDSLADAEFLRLEQDYLMMTRLVAEGAEEPANRQALAEIAARWGVRCGPGDRRCNLDGLEALYRQESDVRDTRRREVARLRLALRDCR
jgi:hypothetical protein